MYDPKRGYPAAVPYLLYRDPAAAARPAEADVEQHEGLRVTTPMRAAVETAASGTDQDVIDSAIAELLDRGRPAACTCCKRYRSWVHKRNWPWNGRYERR